ncbi:MAG: hypothetical protein LQ351_001417 [Letrouitia transgressa]|nr:MAG: hypothetical protein LQ351_001417 [Letrouitia transgressa]
MAELVGAIAGGVTLAALFKACIEAFDLIQTSRNQEIDFKKLRLRLNIEKCRLFIWGESMGLTDTTDADRNRPIDQFRFPNVVRELLENLFDLFHDSHKIKDRYGCRQVSSDDILSMNQSGPFQNLAASFAHFSIRPCHPSHTTRIIQNFAWVIHDRKKFCGLVVEIKDLIDSLQGITSQTVSVARQEGKVCRKIVCIRDTETLSMIAEVCSDEHPDIADAASTKADTMSLASSSRRHVVLWAEGVRSAQGGEEDRASPDLESLTVTELKHKVFEMMRERRGANIAAGSVPELDAEATEVEPLSSLPSTSSASIQLPSISTLLAAPPGDRMDLSLSQNQAQVAHRNVDTVHGAMHSQALGTEASSDQTLRPPSFISENFRMSPASINTENNTIDSSDSLLGHNFQGFVSSYSIRPLVLFQRQYRKPSYDNDSQLSLLSGEGQDFPVVSSASSVSASSNHVHQYNPETRSVSCSVDDPIDRSSIAPMDANPLDQRSFSTMSSKIPQFSSNVSSSAQKKHKRHMCDKRFTRQSSLQTHMYSHTGEKSFNCKFPGCGRRFSVVSNLRRHRKVHRREQGRSGLDSDRGPSIRSSIRG